MRYLWFVFFYVLTAINSPDCRAQLGLNPSGHIGLANISTPEILGQGKKYVAIFGRFSQYGSIDRRGEFLEYIITAAYGLKENADFSLLVPFISAESRRLSLGKINISIKYNILNGPRIKLSISPSFQLPIDKARGHVRNNDLHARFEMGMKLGSGRDSYYLSSGFGAKDHFNSHSNKLESSAFVVLSGGASYRLGMPISLFIELVGERLIKDNDDDLYFQIGIIYNVNRQFIIKGSAGPGLPDKERAETDQRATLGLSYLIN